MTTKSRIWTSSVTLTAMLCITARAAELPGFASELSAGTIAVISDGDFVAESYADGRLAPREAGHQDVLTVISMNSGKITIGSLPVSNSVTAAPEILALTPDGSTAFVTERLGRRSPTAETVRDLPPGNRLFAVDLSDKASPQLADTAEIASFPEGLAVSPDGQRVAVVSNTPDASIVQIVSYAGGRFGGTASFDLAELGVTGLAETPRGGVTATNVQWHPSGRFIAVNINTQNRVAFFEISGTGDAISLRPWGNIVTVGADPFVGRFTPDGSYYLTSDWGRDFGATTLAGRIPQKPSSISVVRLGDQDAPDARHQRIGGTETDLSSEGLAVSPDGRLVATVNMRGTALPSDSGRFQREGSVTLLSFDPATGRLEKAGDYAFEGALPEGGAFDLTGSHFLATVFQGHPGTGAKAGAGLEVFRVVQGGRPGLERVGRLPMPHGVHHVDIAE